MVVLQNKFRKILNKITIQLNGKNNHLKKIRMNLKKY